LEVRGQLLRLLPATRLTAAAGAWFAQVATSYKSPIELIGDELAMDQRPDPHVNSIVSLYQDSEQHRRTTTDLDDTFSVKSATVIKGTVC